MTDLFETQLTEALHRRADERTAPAPSLAELHHRARTAPGNTTAPAPGRGPRLILAGVFTAVVAAVAVGAVMLANNDATPSVEAADQDEVDNDGSPTPEADDGDGEAVNGEAVDIDPDDPLTWPVDEGSPERFRKGPDGAIATFEGEVLNDRVMVFLDGWFLATWDGSEGNWSRPTAEPDTGIETGPGELITDDDLGEVTDVTGFVAAAEDCLVDDTWRFDGPSVEGLHVFADRPELAGLLPRSVTEISARPEDVADVEAALDGTGIEPNITRVVRFDSDGDGTDEVLIEANTLDDGNNAGATADEYSLLLLRRVAAGGEVETISIYEAIGEESTFFVNMTVVVAVADLNGDDTLELVTRTSGFEGGWGSIWNLDGDPAEVIQGGCSP